MSDIPYSEKLVAAIVPNSQKERRNISPSSLEEKHAEVLQMLHTTLPHSHHKRAPVLRGDAPHQDYMCDNKESGDLLVSNRGYHDASSTKNATCGYINSEHSKQTLPITSAPSTKAFKSHPSLPYRSNNRNDNFDINAPETEISIHTGDETGLYRDTAQETFRKESPSDVHITHFNCPGSHEDDKDIHHDITRHSRRMGFGDDIDDNYQEKSALVAEAQTHSHRHFRPVASYLSDDDIKHDSYDSSRLLNELHIHIPSLSASFTACDKDLLALITAISRNNTNMMKELGVTSFAQSSSNPTSEGSYMNGLHFKEISRLDEKVQGLNIEVRLLTTKLEHKHNECEKLRDELGEARQKVRAVETSATQRTTLLSHKREELRKQLLLEEGRTANLNNKNKRLQQEIDKLKQRLHDALR